MLSHYKQKLAEALSQERSLSQEAISLVLMVIHVQLTAPDYTSLKQSLKVVGVS